MGTRSTITVRTNENERKEIYCHWDGYPTNNGRILLEKYNTLDKVLELVELGDLSSLRENIAPADGTQHSFDDSQDGVCIFYDRDRGESGCEARVKTNEQHTDSEQFDYYFDGKQWFVTSWFNDDDQEKTTVKLTEELCESE